MVSQGTLVPQGEVSPIEQFLLDNGAEQTAVPKKVQQPRVRKVKKINLQVSSECKQYFKLVQKHFGKESTLRIAQMHKESSCNKDALGGVGEIGLFQVKASTCDDMGVTGDLFDPETNIRCSAAYSHWLCEVKGHCEVVPNLVAYNAGGEGVKRVRNLSMHPYADGIFKILGLRA
jgi:soluble lytic murein transglycosylase-like protein